MSEPKWPNVHYAPIDYQDIIYYSAPKLKKQLASLDEVDPELRRTFEKLGISLEEQNRLSGVAVDAVFDSVSVATTFKDKLAELGVIFCSFSDAVKNHPDLVEKYLGSVVPYNDNFFATLNSAVFSDGSFCYIPKGVRCPMELSTYFRINAKDTGQFERTLIIAEEGAYVSYLEGCTAPILQLRDQARQMPRTELQDLLDPSRDRFRNHLEIPELHPSGRWLGRRILLGGADEQQAASRYGYEDDPYRQEHPKHHRLERHFRRSRPEHLPWPGEDLERRAQRPQLLAMRFASFGRQMRRAHVPVSGSPESHGPGRA